MIVFPIFNSKILPSKTTEAWVPLWFLIFFRHPKEWYLDEKWPRRKQVLKHELQHCYQWRQYGIIGFPFVYFWYLFTVGYDKHPFEVEANLIAATVPLTEEELKIFF